MSIVTKTGDSGTTGLMYNRRVSKSDPRVEAIGCVDELNAALGWARALATSAALKETIAAVQRDLITLMGELATEVADLPRYLQDGFRPVTAELTGKLDRLAVELEGRQAPRRGWALPGGNRTAAALDVARTVCRRAERRVCALLESGQSNNPELLVYLNRLGDVLWILARAAEAEPGAEAE